MTNKLYECSWEKQILDELLSVAEICKTFICDFCPSATREEDTGAYVCPTGFDFASKNCDRHCEMAKVEGTFRAFHEEIVGVMEECL